MELPESTKDVYNRIQKIEPENASKIIGYLLLQDHGETEMTRLAFGPDNLIHCLINEAKTHLNLGSKSPTPSPDTPLRFTPFSPSSSCLSPLAIQVPEDYRIHNQFRFFEDQIEPMNSPDFSSYYALGPRINRRSPSLPEFPVKICHYFVKGFCKHGNNCRYFHPDSNHVMENFGQMYSPPGLNEEDHVFSPGTLEKLEVEITELLKSRRGCPVSIASLPMLYYEKFGKTLQAEGYLTESQRHGKAGYSLTRLLARLKSICLIDRPHGQHSVILADEVAKYMDYNCDRNEHGGIVPGSKQIYLTFPAESNFSEQDVSNYFKNFGPVHDVRIPCQQKRMFGFVTFAYAETVRQILNKGNPHFVCGARVLVKPYREKSRSDDSRKNGDMFRHSIYHHAHCFDDESELQSMPRICDHSRLLRKQFIEEQHEQALELERRRFSEMHLASKAPKPMNQLPYCGSSLEELWRSAGHTHADQMEFPLSERYSHLLDALNNGSTSEEKISRIKTKNNEQESSQGPNLPDSPFASPLGSGISTVT